MTKIRALLPPRAAALASLLACFTLGLVACANYTLPSSGQSGQMNTWSIVALDPETGDVGVAAASCVPNSHADAIAALVPGVGVAATQAQWNLANRNKVFELLQAGLPADDIISQVSDPEFDSSIGTRQYGVVTLHDGVANTAAFTGDNNLDWAGQQSDVDLAVTVQGNLLVSEAVVSDALLAFSSVDDQGYNTLPDRLMRALEAGSAAGGDARCNNDQVTQTAATAVILVARGTDEPYAAEDIAHTDAGTAKAPWLALSVAGAQFGANPLIELRQQYDEWRQQSIPTPQDNSINPLLLVVVFVVLLSLVVLVVMLIRRQR